MKLFRICPAICVLMIGLALGGSAEAQRVTPGQRERLKGLAAETRRKTIDQRETLRRARTDLMRVYKDYKLDEKKAQAARDQIAKAQSNLLDIHLDHQVEIRRILNRDQFANFREMVGKRMGDREMTFLPPPGEALDNPPPGPAIERLGLSPEQKKRLAGVFGPTPDRRKVADKLRDLSKQVFGMYSNYDLDAAAARKLIDNLHHTQEDLGDLNHKRQQMIRDVLTESQFDQIKAAMAERPRRDFGRRGKRW